MVLIFFMNTIAKPQVERLTVARISFIIITRAGQVRKLVRKSANLQLQTNEKSCGHVDLRTLAV